ncbi:MAG: hypothetical protein AUK34_08895 [Ignavibacteria bacterium CG2_30_36_16]|jgi:PleD family two-component response regulator|nr:hypothetical protein [Ignavibacteria bacterium]OIP58585.1 MAG: hypothetical protein AUK34_08895 [Ignavibacteria bacterium CG2_30_36_16]PJB01526.1 MAG: hypothetical protein CO127_03360 [Ignavibacteria bacterium CG_4_9_14_3_um_filter_36_18]
MNLTSNRILVLDEDAQKLRKLREILTREGFNIITAADKETALELSRHLKFEYVLGNASLLGFTSVAEENKDHKF